MLSNWINTNEIDIIENVCKKYRTILSNNLNNCVTINLQCTFLYEIIKCIGKNYNLSIKCKYSNDMFHKAKSYKYKFTKSCSTNVSGDCYIPSVLRSNHVDLIEYISLLSVVGQNSHMMYSNVKFSPQIIYTSSRLNNIIVDMLTFNIKCIPFYKTPFYCNAKSITNMTTNWHDKVPMYNGIYYCLFMNRDNEPCIFFNDMLFNPVIYGYNKDQQKKYPKSPDLHVYKLNEYIPSEIYAYYFRLIKKTKTFEEQVNTLYNNPTYVIDSVYVHYTNRITILSIRDAGGKKTLHTYNQSYDIKNRNLNISLGYILIHKAKVIDTDTLNYTDSFYSGAYTNCNEVKIVLTGSYSVNVNCIYENIYNYPWLLNFDEDDYRHFINIYAIIVLELFRYQDSDINVLISGFHHPINRELERFYNKCKNMLHHLYSLEKHTVLRFVHDVKRAM